MRQAARAKTYHQRASCAEYRYGLRDRTGRKAERLGMCPPVVLGQRLAEGAGPVGHGPSADLTTGDRNLGDGDRETT